MHYCFGLYYSFLFSTLFFPYIESEVVDFHLSFFLIYTSKAISPFIIIFIVFNKFGLSYVIIINLNNFLIFMLISSLIQELFRKVLFNFPEYNFFYYIFVADFLLNPIVKEDTLKNVIKLQIITIF